MNGDGGELIAVAQQAMWVAAIASAPILLPAMIVGLLTGIIQAATSINESSLSFVPKLVVIGFCLMVFGGTIMGWIVDFTIELFGRIGEVTL